VIEGNAAAGRKLLLTGGGRCNLTHAGSVNDFVRVYGKCGRFLRHCLHTLTPQDTCKFFADAGVETRALPDGCVFPVSERAGDVRDALVAQAEEAGAKILSGRTADDIERDGGQFIVGRCGDTISASKLIIATGGLSYPQTGSTGDGFEFARRLGHTVVLPRPALVPLVTAERWASALAGTSLDNVRISAVKHGDKIAVSGPMVFTQDGIGGPAVLDLSRLLADCLPARQPIPVSVDVAPAMNESKLEEYLIARLLQHSRKIIVNVLFDLVPKQLAGLLCRRAGIAETTGNQLKKEQRREIVHLLKKLPLSITAARPIEEATITRGGVSREEIAPTTMQSRICPGLFFAGEVIDADGPCGGYNLQIAFSTGALAGRN
jgi:hypothetical protein